MLIANITFKSKQIIYVGFFGQSLNWHLLVMPDRSCILYVI